MIHRVKTTSAGALVAAALLAGLAPATAADGPKEPAYTYNAEVVDVIDGDTFDVHVSLGFYVWIRYQRIKLAGIDAPDASEPGGEAAKAELENLIGGKTVILQSIHGDDDPARRDSFGNWLGLVWVDGKSINDAMVESGNAVKAP
jgi:endonuclease YncB( thermonuclease family)